ncbi:YcxB family protein [Aquibacillus koreensis]|uniref:YcxB family protein n=1 Tax=Aquibacillus koreensis TaxID=279446 RepID=A0A9X4AKG6_9BACI|nr:YcxB family protein [Aquibacillus koreensis]MCT2536823.1 YcxB family protein [Aquibacillus koreensis]MDC3421420.1 YcxB family protein [Aquibacillus koreensis]
MEIQFQLEKKDLWELSKNARIYSKRFKTTRFWLYIILIAGIFILSLGNSFHYALFQTLLISAIIFPILEQVMYYVRDKWFINQNFLGERTVILKEDGIELISASKQQLFRWNHYESMVEADDYFFLFDKEGKGIQIPKRALEEDVVDKIRHTLKEHIPMFMQHQPSSIREVVPALQIIVLIFLVILMLINQMDWNKEKDPLSSEREAIYGLFVGVSTEDTVEKIKEVGLELQKDITLEDIVQVSEQLRNAPMSNEFFDFDKYALATLIDQAEILYYDRELPKEQTTGVFSGESEHWKIVDYTVKASPALFRTYAGRMYMKGQDMYEAALFKAEFYIRFVGKDDLFIHNNIIADANEGVKPRDLEISEESTGEFYREYESYRNMQGEPVSIQRY